MTGPPLFDTVAWQDPSSGAPLEPLVSARTPSGVPICGALRVAGTATGYPIVDAVARLTPELAHRHASWLVPFGLTPAGATLTEGRGFQPESTVDSFGWQWTWNSAMRSDADLRMRVAERFGLTPESFSGLRMLDAGAGAGDQSRYLADHGASVVSVDLSSAIEVVATKLRMRPNWVGVQADITALPFRSSQFDCVYCEGVIQHTRDSPGTVRELGTHHTRGWTDPRDALCPNDTDHLRAQNASPPDIVVLRVSTPTAGTLGSVLAATRDWQPCCA